MVNFGYIMTNVIAFFVSISTAVIIVAQRERFSNPSLVGVALGYSFLLPYFMGLFSMMITMYAMGLTCLERLLEYHPDAAPSVRLPCEAAWVTEEDKAYRGEEGSGGAAGKSGRSAGADEGDDNVADDATEQTRLATRADLPLWPASGDLSFDAVSLRYREGLPLAVKDASFEIKSGEKVGIVGRTGAGKSSLVVLLFRVVESLRMAAEKKGASGITIAGRDIGSVGLQTLRRNLVIIPQTPLLLPGTVKHNLDPFGAHTDDELAAVLAKVGLGAHSADKDNKDRKGEGKEKDESNGDGPVVPTSAQLEAARRLLPVNLGSGENREISAGEQQLLSMARVLLRPRGMRKVVVMDEPTANIDMKTDEQVQRLIRTEFADSSVLTIAHRLGTVIDNDKMIVMDKGEVIEFGEPAELLGVAGGARWEEGEAKEGEGKGKGGGEGEQEDSNSGGYLQDMVAAMGEHAARELTNRALQAHEERQVRRRKGGGRGGVVAEAAAAAAAVATEAAPATSEKGGGAVGNGDVRIKIE